MTVTPPALPDFCWPVDWGCQAQFAADPGNESIVLMAEALATQTLRALTAYKVGGCPVTVRPCARRCTPGTTLLAPVGSQGEGIVGPYILDGAWFNSCGCRTADACGCGVVQEIILPGPVGSVTQVQLGTAVLDESAYRVDNDTHLVRTDGEPWPACQDMNLPAGADNTFAVTYTQGALVDALGAAAAGALAFELAQAACGAPCNLPPGVTSVMRSGTSMQIEPGSFPGGLTGIFVVDAFIRYWNPHLVVTASDVFSPDVPRPRRQTWGA